MTDFRRFLNPTSETLEVLAYTGGRFVSTKGRRLRLITTPDTPGWYSFRIRGRNAELVAREEAPLLDGLPLLRGHAWGSHVVLPDASAPALAFLPSDEPLGFAPLVVRRWHDGALVVEGEDFETEHEEQVRGALELGEGLRGLRHVPASLRAAFVYAVCEAEAGPASWQPLELRARLPLLAEGGRVAVRAELQRLVDERARTAEAARVRLEAAEGGADSWETWEEARDRSFATRPRHSSRGRGAGGAEGAVRAALAAAGAAFVSLRSLRGGSQLEVRYRFFGGRFETVVAADSLNVLDAGICLDGADGALTLESLPGVIREAVETGALVVTRGGSW